MAENRFFTPSALSTTSGASLEGGRSVGEENAIEGGGKWDHTLFNGPELARRGVGNEQS